MNNYDLTNVFDGVKPVAENSIPRLVTMLQVEEQIEEDKIPSRLLITVNGEQVIRYQNLEHLPVEVRDVIGTLPGSMGFSKHILLEKIEKLKIAVENLKPTEPPKFVAGDPIRIIQDELGMLMNEEVIGKFGVVKEVVPLGTDYKYIVDVMGDDGKLLKSDFPLFDLMMHKVNP